MTALTKNELRDLAVDGARNRIAALEKELSRLHREFPELFIGKAQPMILAAERRAEAVAKSNGHAASWTPERRAQQAERMRRMQTGGGFNQKRKGKRKGKASTASGKNWGMKWYARLKAHGPERLHASGKALGAATSSLLTSSKRWRDAGSIRRRKDGQYEIGDAAPPE